MKKSYETPSVEKIKFNYRDQVVAASGGEAVVDGAVTGGNSTSDRANEVVDYLLNGAGVRICDSIGDWVGSWFA